MQLLKELWQAGVDAVGGYRATQTALRGIDRPDRVLAVGKAAAAMARAASEQFDGVPTLVVTKDGHGDELGKVLPDQLHLIEASHPVPDARSLAAGKALRQAVSEMPGGSDLLLLVSGGASSLAEDLVDGFDLPDLAALNRRLLSQGLDIAAMNAERRRISHIKGGGLLAAFHGRRVRVLAISDVPGDDIGVIGSGIGLCPPEARFECKSSVIASNEIARAAVAKAARAHGLAVLDNEESLHASLPDLTRSLGSRLRDMPRGVMILGGEPTVTLPANPGRGGRNQALALALAGEIAGRPDLHLIVGGTDGTDGPTDAAGGVVDGTTWGPGAREALQRADSGTYLAQGGALLETGPTGTNVMDLAIALRR
ncbi:DUF4147 domain-containing protein [Primorskyibacter sp. S87]|uniref:DUF4147 domain-containing protein n=1 Tax=Primorskyibacter sp. S87 TaxID=3415126 RepID=UPI003C7CCE2D